MFFFFFHLFLRSKDQYLEKFPCEIQLDFTHNHIIMGADALRHRPPSEELENIFREYFSQGLSPSTALDNFKSKLEDENPDNYVRLAGDGSVVPTRKWCYDLYYKIFKQEFGAPDGENMIEMLNTKIEEFNKLHGKSVLIDNGDQPIVVICTPLFKRVLSLRSANEALFIDSSGNMDRHNSRVFLLLVPSAIGALPLGVMMTFSENESTITKGLNLFMELIGDQTYCPNIIITDDCTAERNSLRKVFPAAHLLLCKFHVLQSIWRYLWDGKHQINGADRQMLFSAFKKVLNSETETLFLENFKEMITNSITLKYPNYIKYLHKYEERKEEWAMFARQDLLIRNNHTNNYSEAGMRVLKDKVLKRTKAFNVVQLFTYLAQDLNDYYKRKIIDFVNNRFEGLAKKKHNIQADIQNFTCKKVDEWIYEVQSGINTYYVNNEIGTCSCIIGSNGSPCKHQYAVVTTYQLSSERFIPLNDSIAKEKLYFIATGQVCENNTWFKNLIPGSETHSVQEIQNNTESTVSEIVVEPEPVLDEIQSVNPNTIEELKNVFANLEARVVKDPATFEAPIKKFVELFNNVKSDSHLISALHTFGKYNGVLPMKKNVQGGKNIGVQPTALARRKSRLGGRNPIRSGRPTKAARREHPYAKQRNSLGAQLQNQKKKAPHSLSYCHQQNISLGKQH